MTKQEILVTAVGEMNDLISCDFIYNGKAQAKPPEEPEEEPRAVSNLDTILEMR